jgi:nucleotide-binding universal stress UspA family protein
VILVGYDDSDQARDALALGRLLARTRQAPLTAVSVYTFQKIHRIGDDELERALRELAEQQVRGALAPAGEPRPELLAAPGHSVPEGLQRVADELGAEALVVGSTHHGSVTRALASVPERLLQGAACPVAIAPRGYATAAPATLREIGVAFDGGPESRTALAAGTALARAAGARLRAITVLNPHVSPFTPKPMAAIEMTDYVASGRQRRIDALRAAVAELRDVDAVAEPVDGDEVETLAARSAELDLLVVGSRRYGPLRRLLLGAVSARLVRQAAGPLLLLPRGAQGQDAAPAPEG